MKRGAPKKNSTFILNLEKEILECADLVGIDYETAVDITDKFFVSMKRFLTDPRMPLINLKHFGKFGTNIGSSRAFLLRMIYSYKNNPTFENRSIAIDAILRFWPIRDRQIHADGFLKREHGKYSLNKINFNLEYKKKMLGDKFSDYYDQLGRRIRYDKNIKTDTVDNDE